MPVKKLWETEKLIEQYCWDVISKIQNVRNYIGLGFFNKSLTKKREEKESLNHET